MTKSQTVVVILLGLIATGFLVVTYFIISMKPPDVVPTALIFTITSTSGPSITPSSTATRIVLPATWTPVPSEVPSLTPTRPTRTLLQSEQSNHHQHSTESIELQGNRSINSYIFWLQDKSVVINWTYYGVP